MSKSIYFLKDWQKEGVTKRRNWGRAGEIKHTFLSVWWHLKKKEQLRKKQKQAAASLSLNTKQRWKQEVGA